MSIRYAFSLVRSQRKYLPANGAANLSEQTRTIISHLCGHEQVLIKFLFSDGFLCCWSQIHIRNTGSIVDICRRSYCPCPVSPDKGKKDVRRSFQTVLINGFST